MTTQSTCAHGGDRPLIWLEHDQGTGYDLCRCQDCGATVEMEPPEDDVCPLCGELDCMEDTLGP